MLALIISPVINLVIITSKWQFKLNAHYKIKLRFYPVLKRSVIKDNKGTMSRYEGIFEVNKGYFVFSYTM